ncbi:[acyl-carrier-protein] S-malonyltransferase [Bacillus sp. FJAT-42376]|uniref:ACP S-malonyltransferase n=1 Tax=Bacillus sp. FJAT-42376 TaxID=2014076 RepID=UPI000F4F38DE|nr:ACP S-malonyltransferase [Bacillus sp. FJAT-42376]AZB42906.1 [acyl-carrier-protein] S-malonyltransferase [Bacillus sp. FJAT-42376]
MSKIAFVFPGQGSQTVGMGQDFAEQTKEGKALFQKADEVLEANLSQIMLEGPKEELTLTYNAQPALVTASIAAWQLLDKEGIRPDYTAGHSLGEYSALVASGVLSFEDAVLAVRRRGEFMNEAVPAGEGAMAAIMGMEAPTLREIAQTVTEEGHSVQLANLNCPGQIVISGTAKGVELASAKAKEAGAKRAIPLDVSGPFHSELMKPAANQLKSVLDNMELKDASIPVIANVTAQPEKEGGRIQELLIQQLYSPVRWEESVKTMIENGVDTFVEIGSGKVLSGLIKKIDRNVKTLSVSDMATLQAAVEALKEES